MLLNINNIMKKKVYQIASFKTTFSKKFQLLPAPHKRTGLDRHLHSILGFKNLAPPLWKSFCCLYLLASMNYGYVKFLNFIPYLKLKLKYNLENGSLTFASVPWSCIGDKKSQSEWGGGWLPLIWVRPFKVQWRDMPYLLRHESVIAHHHTSKISWKWSWGVWFLAHLNVVKLYTIWY